MVVCMCMWLFVSVCKHIHIFLNTVGPKHVQKEFILKLLSFADFFINNIACYPFVLCKHNANPLMCVCYIMSCKQRSNETISKTTMQLLLVCQVFWYGNCMTTIRWGRGLLKDIPPSKDIGHSTNTLAVIPGAHIDWHADLHNITYNI